MQAVILKTAMNYPDLRFLLEIAKFIPLMRILCHAEYQGSSPGPLGIQGFLQEVARTCQNNALFSEILSFPDS